LTQPGNGGQNPFRTLLMLIEKMPTLLRENERDIGITEHSANITASTAHSMATHKNYTGKQNCNFFMMTMTM